MAKHKKVKNVSVMNGDTKKSSNMMETTNIESSDDEDKNAFIAMPMDVDVDPFARGKAYLANIVSGMDEEGQVSMKYGSKSHEGTSSNVVFETPMVIVEIESSDEEVEYFPGMAMGDMIHPFAAGRSALREMMANLMGNFPFGTSMQRTTHMVGECCGHCGCGMTGETPDDFDISSESSEYSTESSDGSSENLMDPSNQDDEEMEG